MKIIAENLHIISPQIKQAILSRDKEFIKSLLKRIVQTNPDWVDFNVGPAKGHFAGVMTWLLEILYEIKQVPISFDTTNAEEIRTAISIVQEPFQCIINSATAEPSRLEPMTDLAAEFGTKLVALTLNNELGIPKTADMRLELAFEIVEKAQAKGIANENLLFDPLILPVGVDQSQVNEALTAIRMFKESFEPVVQTTIGLSNVSNGVPAQHRPLLNRVFAVLASGAGLDTLICDSFDEELLRIVAMLEVGVPQKSYDELFLQLKSMIFDFGDLADINFNEDDVNQCRIYKTAEILLNKKIYSASFLEG